MLAWRPLHRAAARPPLHLALARVFAQCVWPSSTGSWRALRGGSDPPSKRLRSLPVITSLKASAIAFSKLLVRSCVDHFPQCSPFWGKSVVPVTNDVKRNSSRKLCACSWTPSGRLLHSQALAQGHPVRYIGRYRVYGIIPWRSYRWPPSLPTTKGHRTSHSHRPTTATSACGTEAAGSCPACSRGGQQVRCGYR